MLYKILGAALAGALVTNIAIHLFITLDIPGRARKKVDAINSKIRRWYRKRFLPKGYAIETKKFPSLIFPNYEFRLFFWPPGSITPIPLDMVRFESEIPILINLAWNHLEIYGKPVRHYQP